MSTITRPTILDRTLMGTETCGDEDAYTFEQRLSRCYELAGYAVTLGDLGDGTLVHGSMQGPYEGNRRIGHAWVLLATEPGERQQVWEPVSAMVHWADEWYAYASAREEKQYNAEQARIRIMRYSHWGRWHKSKHP